MGTETREDLILVVQRTEVSMLRLPALRVTSGYSLLYTTTTAAQSIAIWYFPGLWLA